MDNDEPVVGQADTVARIADQAYIAAVLNRDDPDALARLTASLDQTLFEYRAAGWDELQAGFIVGMFVLANMLGINSNPSVMSSILIATGAMRALAVEKVLDEDMPQL